MDLYDYKDKNFNYCHRCWMEFTTLTDAERVNLQRLIGKDTQETKKGRKKYVSKKKPKFICRNTGQVFKTTTEAAKFLKISHGAISNGFKKSYNNCYVVRQGPSKGFILERI